MLKSYSSLAKRLFSYFSFSVYTCITRKQYMSSSAVIALRNAEAGLPFAMNKDLVNIDLPASQTAADHPVYYLTKIKVAAVYL